MMMNRYTKQEQIRLAIETTIFDNRSEGKFDLLGCAQDRVFSPFTRSEIAVELVALIEDGRVSFDSDGWHFL